MFSCSFLVCNVHETEKCVIRDVLNGTLSLKDNDSEPDAAEYFGFPPKRSFSKKRISGSVLKYQLNFKPMNHAISNQKKQHF